MRIAFIGLGVMGFPMAGHLARAGHEVCVYNRTLEKAKRWVGEYGGQMAQTPALAAANADMVFACVGNDDDLRAVTLNDGGAFQSMQPGSLFIDHTTASAQVARELNQQAKARNFGFMDAPVSGGQAGAENGQLAIMLGGDEADFDRAAPVLACYAKAAKLIGPVGSGQLTKMVNQICIAGLVQGLAEALHFAEKAELDVERVIEVISNGAAQSWQMENRWRTMLNNQFDFGFAVDWMRKDLAIAMEEAKRNGATLPITQIVDSFYAEIQAMGGNRWDTSSLIARIKNNS